jgi:hypothetical protein
MAASACASQQASDGRSESELDSAITLQLADGSVARGLPIAAYDHAGWWWDAAPEVTYALFDEARASEVPELDRSLRFVDRSELAPGQVPPAVTASSAGTGAFASWMRSRGVVLGRLPLDGVATVLNGHERWHLDEGGFGDFAWDLVREAAPGRTYRTDGLTNEDYAVWDSPVYLPTGGYVVDVDDTAPDNPPGVVPPGSLRDVKNNMVGVEVAGAYYVYLLHFRQGSIPRASRGTCEPQVAGVRCVEPGAFLPAGTYLGRAGNAGVTYEPHVHVTAYYWDASREPKRSWSVPAEFASLYRRAPGEASSRLDGYAVPKTGDALSNEPF